MSWTALSGSRIGAQHTRTGLPLQDAHATWADQGHAVVAVADGHGHHLHFRSDVGATLAVEIVLDLLQAALPSFTEPTATEQALVRVGADLVDRWTRAVLDHAAGNPLTAREAVYAGGSPTRPYGTTVLALAASDTTLAALQIGDGDLVVVTASGSAVRPLPEDPDLDGVHTSSLCQPRPLDSLRVAALPLDGADPVGLGFVVTDGFGKARVEADWWRQTGEDLLGFAREHGYPWITERLDDWLDEPAQLGGDDTTLALLGRTKP
ncbi:MAG: PP2C family serine/threonine-protein phosphatase [Nocardioides sp.]